MVSLYDTHWGNFNKFAKFIKMARVQRVKATHHNCGKKFGIYSIAQ
jgi:hypothetical protein